MSVGGAAGSEGKRSLRPLVGLLAAMAVALTGTRVSAIALPWFVLVTTGSATLTGLVAFCEMAPYVLAKALSGPVLDRIGTRVVSWTADLASAVAAAVVPVLHLMGLLPFWALLVLVAVIGAVRGPGDLAKQVMVPEAADRSGVVLERATGLSGVTERLASTVGPFAGGLLIAVTSPVAGLMVNAVCFALGAVIVSLLLPRAMGRTPRPESPAGSGPAGGAPPARDEAVGYWRQLGSGFRYLRTERLLLTIYLMVAVTNLLDAAFSAVLLPVWADESGNGPAAIGLVAAAGGGSAVVGSLIAAGLAHRLRRRPVFFFGFLFAGAPRFLVLALDVPLWVVVTVFVVSGFGGGFLNPIIAAVCFERVPRAMLGRVVSLGGSLAWAGIPLGGLIGGVGVTALGLTTVLVIAAAAYFLVTTLTGLRHEWREMDARRMAARAADAPADGDPPAGVSGDPAPGGPAPVGPSPVGPAPGDPAPAGPPPGEPGPEVRTPAASGDR
ncbi:MFS transporter [Streptomyces sp. SM14]|uniref:MFS transporter n=2 Tax=unclassified Streptomyces TaxID=2593676 RepID=UPI00215665A2|nr:MFS transporter [Streptomyces sp. SM14]